jgi:N,N-dimethylformamidase
VTASYSGSHGKLEISATSLATDGGRARSLVGSAAAPAGCRWPASTPLILAAEWPGDGAENARAAKHFNGKIDRPRLYAKAVSADFMRSLVESLHPSPADPDLLAAWDFSSDMSSDTCWDISAHALHGEAHHLPMRAATGANWTGQVQSWKEDPTQYGAIHFHDDDLEDVGWAASCEYEIPADLKSGFYSLEATGEVDGRKVESHTIFFVRPPAGKRTADVLVIAPTATYLAYANNHSRIDQTHFEVMADGLMVLSQDDLFTHAHREFGMSLYDTHSDLSGSCYSSAARPIINGRPRSSTFNYVNDTHFLDWLEEERVGYDVVTDEDIHRKGASLLASYPVVVNMTHPEYYSREMLDALTAYQNGGGRHMYLGGNGFYWRVTFHPKKQGVIELRRGITGLRSWEAEAGEGSLSFTGEPSGLWRSSGRAPQRLCGVGFSAQVFDHSGSYRRLADSFDPRAAFVFDGIGDDEVIGNFGLRLGGAAGLEIDRSDRDLGSPPEMLVLATADQMGPGGIPAPEELPALYRGFTGEESNIARADIVLCPTDKGGAVFSTGSIAWCCALSHNGYDNNVSRMTRNVLRRFMDPSPLDLSESGRERTR